MIVVAIIGILAAIAYPSYQEHVRKTKRVEAQSELMILAQKLQRYKISHFTFLQSDHQPITLENIGESAGLTLPRQDHALYDVYLDDVTASTWILKAIPKENSSQYIDGGFALNHRGEKCWIKGHLTCIPSANTNWNGQ